MDLFIKTLTAICATCTVELVLVATVLQLYATA